MGAVMIAYDISGSWRKAGLTPVLYHCTFAQNVKSILKDRALIARKGGSICQSPEDFVSLAERVTKGLIEFCGEVVFEFDAVALCRHNPCLVPRDYGLSEEETWRYEDFPFFEHEWRAPTVVEFELADLNRVLLVNRPGSKPGLLTHVARRLDTAGVPYLRLDERHLADDVRSDTIRYFVRLECWARFRRGGRRGTPGYTQVAHGRGEARGGG